MIENLTDLFLYEVAPDLNITGGGGLFGQETEQFLRPPDLSTTPIQTC